MKSETLILLIVLASIAFGTVILWYYMIMKPRIKWQKETVKHEERMKKIRHEQKASYRHKANVDFHFLLKLYGENLPQYCDIMWSNSNEHTFWYWNAIKEFYDKEK